QERQRGKRRTSPGRVGGRDRSVAYGVHLLGVCAGMGPVLACPWGICIDKDGNILVADWGEQHRIVLYPAQGVGWPIVRQGLSSPRGLTLLPDGQLAVSDSILSTGLKHIVTLQI
uniref:NHL repeat containing 4 n=1 Tax=Poecilia mexicana TaxID=48701 RepID=A0A3B3Y4X0_9TELE